eukprot:CAMPEP_0116918752 /NCGR_PEP_ID=MMETSP0467-20121206/19953_1 /TAXON_ID=283647 /ORGANISM="Mesodinium pulex, Strain SPMC105" /LENGTH=71 /DNA_ID=CAMNT_0004596151 /DNA_START=777 /DNA_END=992 /DNA_ORIENTATION=-
MAREFGHADEQTHRCMDKRHKNTQWKCNKKKVGNHVHYLADNNTNVMVHKTNKDVKIKYYDYTNVNLSESP